MTTFQIQFGVELSIKLKASHVGKNWQIPDPIFINTIKTQSDKSSQIFDIDKLISIDQLRILFFCCFNFYTYEAHTTNFLYGKDTWVICRSIDWHLLENFSISTDFGSFYNAQLIMLYRSNGTNMSKGGRAMTQLTISSKSSQIEWIWMELWTIN